MKPDPDKTIQDTRQFIEAIVEMTEGNANINKRSIVKPGVSLAREARRLKDALSKAAVCPRCKGDDGIQWPVYGQKGMYEWKPCPVCKMEPWDKLSKCFLPKEKENQ